MNRQEQCKPMTYSLCGQMLEGLIGFYIAKNKADFEIFQ
jgi:hypothetical protein